jgi:hypothetical protein
MSKNGKRKKVNESTDGVTRDNGEGSDSGASSPNKKSNNGPTNRKLEFTQDSEQPSSDNNEQLRVIPDNAGGDMPGLQAIADIQVIHKFQLVKYPNRFFYISDCDWYIGPNKWH